MTTRRFLGLIAINIHESAVQCVLANASAAARSIAIALARQSVSDELSYVKPHKYGVARGVQWPCVFIFSKSVFCQDPTRFWESLGGLSRSTIHLFGLLRRP